MEWYYLMIHMVSLALISQAGDTHGSLAGIDTSQVSRASTGSRTQDFFFSGTNGYLLPFLLFRFRNKSNVSIDLSAACHNGQK